MLNEEKLSEGFVSKFLEYSRSEEAIWFWAVIATLIIYMILVPLSNLISRFQVLRVIFGGIVALFLPGYALIRALFMEKQIEKVERIALSIGLSLALTPMVSFILNFLPWGIRLTPLITGLTLLTMTFASVGLLRQFSEKTLKKI